MYIQLTDKQINEHIGIVHFSNLNELNRVRVNELFVNVNLQDALILYQTTDECPIFLGYFILDKTPITESALFESYQQNMIAAGEEESLISFEHCLHLRSWVFDKQLDNKIHIGHVVSYIASSGGDYPQILWCECGDELLCYRIEPNLLKQISQTLLILRYISLKEARLNK